MRIPDRITAKEFNQLMNRGVIRSQGKKLVEGELSPDFLLTLDNIDGFFIPGEVYSSKNSKQIYRKDGKPFITDSLNVKKYKKDTFSSYVKFKDQFIEKIENLPLPVVLEFTFFRKTLQRFDFQNMVQVVCDQLVSAGWLPDDSMNFLLPIPPLPPKKAFIHNKTNPGVLIKVVT